MTKGETFCKLNSFMQMVSLLASLLTLCAIAYDRYVGIMKPLKALNHRPSHCLIIIALIWIVSFAISIPTLMYRTYSEQIWLDYVKKTCDDLGWPFVIKQNADGCNVKVQPWKRLYYSMVIICLFFLPTAIMSILYTLIMRKLWTKDEFIDQTIEDMQRKKRKERRQKSIVMLIIILIVFFICW